jgi:hypothetical protein
VRDRKRDDPFSGECIARLYEHAILNKLLKFLSEASSRISLRVTKEPESAPTVTIAH